MKKLFFAVGILALVMVTNVFATERTLSIDKVIYDSGRVTVVGKSGSEAGADVSMKITDGANPARFFAIDETITDKNGIYTFEINMPAEAENVPENGELILKIQGSEATDTEQKTVYYATEAVRNEIIQKLKEIDKAEDPIQAAVQIAQEPKYRAGLFSMGVDMDVYASDESLSAAAMKIFTDSVEIAELDENGVKSALNESIYIAVINSGADVAQTLTKMNPVYEKSEFTSAEAGLANWLANKINAEKPFHTIESFDTAYAKANIFYAASHSRSGEFEKLIGEAVKYGLSSEIYNAYMQTSDKIKVDDNLVKLLDGKEVNTMSEFETAIKNAIETANKGTTTVKPGSGGGGGSSSGGSNYSIPVLPPEQNIPEKVTFQDLDSVEWAKEAIKALAAGGIINGYGDSTFRPNQEVSREEFVKMLAGVCDISGVAGETGFEDVPPTAWYYESVMACKQHGIINGVDENQFGTGLRLTRQDMATIVYRAAQFRGILLPEIREYQAFSDENNIGSYAQEAIKELYCAGKINGISVSVFEPQSYCTRAQVAKILYDVFMK